MFLNSMAFVPTIALNNTVSYVVLRERKCDVEKDFPPIRVWGTIGFIAAMWLVDLACWTKIEKGPIRIATVRGLGYCLEKIPG
jgi:NHS family xanthosine MFS transporter